MNNEHKKELIQEEQREMREEPMNIWIEEHLPELEEEFIRTFPKEEQPLDDDTPRFLDDYCDDFDDYARKQYNEDIKC